MTQDELPLFLDFEASGLQPETYPIAVAWSQTTGEIESYLIRPLPEWTHWDADAERVHRIPRERLAAEGRDALFVARRMNEQLGDQVVWCDGGSFDRGWLDMLVEAAGVKPGFELRDIVSGLIPDEILYTHLWDQFVAEAWSHVEGRRHDPASDVRYLIELYRLAARAAGN